VHLLVLFTRKQVFFLDPNWMSSLYIQIDQNMLYGDGIHFESRRNRCLYTRTEQHTSYITTVLTKLFYVLCICNHVNQTACLTPKQMYV